MKNNNLKKIKRENRHRRIRAKVSGDKNRPRLAIFRSNNEIYASLVNDLEGKTLLSCSSRKITDKDISEIGDKLKDLDPTTFRRQAKSFATGYQLASQAKKEGIKRVVFDRGGYIYTGRVRSLAEGARAGGLEF